MDYKGFGECQPARVLPKLIDKQQTMPRMARLTAAAAAATATNISNNPNTTWNMNHTIDNEHLIAATTKSEMMTTVLKRICNVDVDPKNISDRREWATAQHHTYYNPHCLFELEIRWLIATSCLLGDLITTWSQRTGTMLAANQVAFHLIPIPCDPFAEFDPLRSNCI
jgi:hypothetical protein